MNKIIFFVEIIFIIKINLNIFEYFFLIVFLRTFVILGTSILSIKNFTPLILNSEVEKKFLGHLIHNLQFLFFFLNSRRIKGRGELERKKF